MSVNPLAPEWLVHPDDANALAAQVWPQNAARTASGALTIAGVDAITLAQQFGTPLYVVDEDDVRARATSAEAAFARAFAVGARPRSTTPARRSSQHRGRALDDRRPGSTSTCAAAESSRSPSPQASTPLGSGITATTRAVAEIERCRRRGRRA